jgi:hypothetical protein
LGCGKTPGDTEIYSETETVSFADGIPADWETAGCEIDNSEGRGDSQSLKIMAGGSIVCQKTGSETVDMAEFYLKGEGVVRLYIDGELKNELEVTDDWQRCAGYLPAAQHEIKWECVAVPGRASVGMLKSGASVAGVYMDDVRFASGFAVGKPYGGGIVACVEPDGKAGLIVAKTNQTTEQGISWDAEKGGDTGATETGYGHGMSNTQKMVSALGSGNYAASIVYGQMIDGYNDWFLPSREELEHIGKNCRAIGNFSISGWYWSSSDYAYSEGFMGRPSGWKAAPVCINPDGLMCGNSPVSEMRYQQYQVRAVRKFSE